MAATRHQRDGHLGMCCVAGGDGRRCDVRGQLVDMAQERQRTQDGVKRQCCGGVDHGPKMKARQPGQLACMGAAEASQADDRMRQRGGGGNQGGRGSGFVASGNRQIFIE